MHHFLVDRPTIASILLSRRETWGAHDLTFYFLHIFLRHHGLTLIPFKTFAMFSPAIYISLLLLQLLFSCCMLVSLFYFPLLLKGQVAWKLPHAFPSSWMVLSTIMLHNLVTVPPAPPFLTPSVLTGIFTVTHGIQSSPLRNAEPALIQSEPCPVPQQPPPTPQSATRIKQIDQDLRK